MECATRLISYSLIIPGEQHFNVLYMIMLIIPRGQHFNVLYIIMLSIPGEQFSELGNFGPNFPRFRIMTSQKELNFGNLRKWIIPLNFSS